jgi:WD40 repeat protein
VRRGTLIATLNADQPLFRVQFSPDGTQLLAGGRSSRTWIWDVRTRRLVRYLLGHRGGVGDLAISADGQTLATLGIDQTVRLWHLPTGEELFASLPGHAPAWLQFASPRELVIGMAAGDSRTGAVYLLDARQHEQERDGAPR